MSFDSHQLDVIEEKLAIGFPLSVGEDTEPVEHLVVSFRKIWQWYNEYPEFNSKFDETLFRTVYDDMSSKFRNSNLEAQFEDEKSESNSPSDMYNANSNQASDDVRHSSSVPFEDDKHDKCDSESPTNVEETNSEKVSDEVSHANADAESITTDQNANAIPVFDLCVECGLCDREFPLLNNDPTYAYQIHAQTSEHIEAEDALKNLRSLAIDDTTSTLNVSNDNASSPVCDELNGASKVSVDAALPVANASSSAGNAECNVPSSSTTNDNHSTFYQLLGRYTNTVSCGNVSNVRQRGRSRKEQPTQKKTKDEYKEDQWIQQKGKWKYCILCDVNLPGPSQIRAHINGQVHQEDSPLVQIHVGNKYSCTLCNAADVMSLDKLHEHLAGKRHTQKLDNREQGRQTGNNPSPSSNSTNFFEISVVSPSNIYRVSCESRMVYFLNKACIFTLRDTLGFGIRIVCYLCNQDFLAEDHIVASDRHRSRVAEVVKKSNPKTATLDVGVLPDKRKKKVVCHLCNIKMQENDTYCYFLHVTSRHHMERVRECFKSTKFRDWERGIVLRDGQPYCVFCELILPDEKSMLEHLADPAHKTFCDG